MDSFNLATYHAIFLYLFLVLAFATVTLVMAHMVGPRRQTPVKQMPYESGMDPVGDARQRFDFKFYLIAISFLIFDVELLFLYPWAVIAYQDPAVLPAAMKTPVFFGVLIFIGLLTLAFVYEWRKGVFKWR